MKGIFNKDITWKIISICVAIILWLYVADVNNPYISSNYKGISVNFINADVMEQYNLVFLEGEDQDVTVRLRGRRNLITEIRNDSIKATVDLSGLKGLTGISEFSIPIQIDLPLDDIEIVNQEPYSATVVVDKIIQVQVPIDVVTNGEPLNTYVIDEPIVNPLNASITGPSSILARIKGVRALVDVSGYSNDVNRAQEYVLVDGDGNKIENEHVQINTDDIKVNVPIKKRKEVPITHQFIGAPVENYIISGVRIVPDKIAIIGNPDKLEEIDVIITEPINIDNITESVNISIPLILEEDIEVENNRVSVVVRIDVQEEETRKIVTKNININNPKNGFDYNIETEELEVQVLGAKDLLEHLKSENIKISVDVSRLVEGVHEINADIIVPSGIRVGGNYNVTVRVDRQEG